MITAPPGSIYAQILDLVRQYPGEYSDRPLWVGRVCVAGVPEVADSPLPRRWVDRMREAGMLRPPRVRLAPHVKPHHIEREDGQARAILEALLCVEDGLSAADLARIVAGSEDPSGAFERCLQGLYRDGLCTPPGAVWAR